MAIYNIDGKIPGGGKYLKQLGTMQVVNTAVPSNANEVKTILDITNSSGVLFSVPPIHYDAGQIIIITIDGVIVYKGVYQIGGTKYSIVSAPYYLTQTGHPSLVANDQSFSYLGSTEIYNNTTLSPLFFKESCNITLTSLAGSNQQGLIQANYYLVEPTDLT